MNATPEQLTGKRVLVLSPQHKETIIGTFVRTNIVIGQEQKETLYATVQKDDGSFAAFDFNRAVIVTA